MADRPVQHGAAASPHDAGRSAAPWAVPGVDHGGELLLVEDDAGDALLVSEVLSDSGMPYDVVWRKTLTEAKAYLAGRVGAVCVLLDLHLPDTQGLVAVRQVLDISPDAAIVVLTGLTESEAGLSAVAAGAQDFLAKDRLDAEQLGRAIRYALQRKQVERAGAELQVGRLRAQENARLERGLLPTPLLRDDGCVIASRYSPGRDHALLGGDFYDVVQTADGTLHAVIGDVSGHGAAEAALGVCLRVAWRAAVLSGCVGTAQIRLLEEILTAERAADVVFATLTTLRLGPAREELTVIRAGHPGLLLRHREGLRLYEPPAGPALGLLAGQASWPETALATAGVEAVTVFTDGLFEGVTAPRNRLGEEGLLALARGHLGLRSRAFVDAVVDDVIELTAPYGGLADDVAVLDIAWTGPR
ncbi:PP2C family protein-serine/threonine phosphatase [Streptomyces sp. NPDC050560]|uniref:PP2C family protein-serine/threonine phosphatase n=1 Tax=Streptomyces sp. NPDC050560 TaxID=3365630 RepID=UPI0037916057